MPTQAVTVTIEGRECTYRPYPAFRSISEWGSLASTVGESVLYQILQGDLDLRETLRGVLEDKKEGEERDPRAFLTQILPVLVDYLGTEDFGLLVERYLRETNACVMLDGKAVSLHEEDSAAQGEIEDLEILLVLLWWEILKRCLRPLSRRLSSINPTQATKTTPADDSAKSAPSA